MTRKPAGKREPKFRVGQVVGSEKVVRYVRVLGKMEDGWYQCDDGNGLTFPLHESIMRPLTKREKGEPR